MRRRLAVVTPTPGHVPTQAVLRVVHDRLSWPALLVVGGLMLFAASVASAITLAARPAVPVYLPTLIQVVEQVPAHDDSVWLTPPQSSYLVYWIDARGVLVQTWCIDVVARDVLLAWIAQTGGQLE
jgi:hypothetical protein